MYSLFLWAWIHLEEIDFSIISAFKSQVNPGIGFQHSKVSSHFPFLVTHVFCISNAACFLCTLFVRRIHSLQFDSINKSTSRSIKDLTGKLRQLVENLSKAAPVLEFFETRIWPMELASETKDALDIAFREHRKDMIALKKVHEEEKEALRRMYGRTERRRRMDFF